MSKERLRVLKLMRKLVEFCEQKEMITAEIEVNELKQVLSEVERLQAENKIINVECEDCGFEYHKQHEIDIPKGGYSCPLCELQQSQQKVERLEKAMKENLTPATYYIIQQIALETEGKE
jgi:predicted Zn-ribbon and HTH transcriptional regulator